MTAMDQQQAKLLTAINRELKTESVGENKITPDGGRESEQQTSDPNPDIPLASSASKSPPTETHCQITCETEKKWWDKAKPCVEVVGVFLLAVYTFFTIQMYCANKEAADAAKSAAQIAADTLKANAAAIQIDQRAWMTIAKFELYEEPTEGKKIRVKFFLINSGKTPAVKCVTERQPLMQTGPRGTPSVYANDQWPDGPKTKRRPIFIVMPVAEQDETEPWEILSPDLIRQYRTKSYLLYVLAKVWYDDVFGHSHWTTTCRWHEFGRPPTEFWPCTGGTEIDNPYQQSKKE